jgi:hypothetical protein
MVCRDEQPPHCARGAVCGVVGVVCTRARGLDMRPCVCAELPLYQRGEGEKQQRRCQHINRWPPEFRWKNAKASIGCHHR